MAGAEDESTTIRHQAGRYSLKFGPRYFELRQEMLSHYTKIGRTDQLDQLQSIDKAPSDWLPHLAKMVVCGLEESYGHMDPLFMHSAKKMASRLLALYGRDFESHLIACLRLRLRLLQLRAEASKRDNAVTLHDEKFIDFLAQMAELDSDRRHKFAYYAWQGCVALLSVGCQLPQRWRAVSGLINCHQDALLCRCPQSGQHSDSWHLIGQLRRQLVNNRRLAEFTASQSLMMQTQLMLTTLDNYLSETELIQD